MYGMVTGGEVVDRDGQIVDPDWAADKLMDWFHDLGAPVRNMHAGNYPPAGKGISLDIEDDRSFIAAKIMEPTAVKLLDAGVYRDFSIGIAEANLYPDPVAPNGRLGRKGDKTGFVNEVSLVDTGSHPDAHIMSIVKRAAADAPFDFGEALVPPPDRMNKAVRKAAKKAAKDPNVGGGVDRSEMPKKDFVFPEDAPGGGFPIAKPGDVSDAVSSWGRYRGDRSFEEFQRRLTAIARRKGDAYVRELPQNWKDDMADGKKTKAADANKEGAAVTTAKAQRQALKAAHKAGMEHDGAECPKCIKAAAVEAAKVNAPKGDDAMAGVKVPVRDDAVEGVADAIMHAREPDDDEAGEKAAGSVAVAGAPTDGNLKPGVTLPAPKAAKKKGKKGKPAFLTQGDGDGGSGGSDGSDGGDGGDGGGGKDKFPFKKKGKAKKAAGPDYATVRLHDLLCPGYSLKSCRTAYGEVTPAAIDLEAIRLGAAEVIGSRKAAPGSVAEAAQALAAATGLTTLEGKTFADLKRAAHKAWLDADPSLPSLRPGLISPESFRRGYLSGANSSTSTTTTVPTPDLKAPERPERGTPVTPNTMGKRAGGAKARTFYTNAAKDEHAVMMGQLHDWIAGTYPGCCPIAEAPGGPIDTDGQMGRPAEMNAPLPATPGQVPSLDDSAPVPAQGMAAAAKSADDKPPDVDALVKKRTKAATKSMRKELKEMRAAVKAMGAAPDPRHAALRSQPFAPRRRLSAKKARKLAEAKEAAQLIATRHSTQADEGLEELRNLGLSPKEFARIAVGG